MNRSIFISFVVLIIALVGFSPKIEASQQTINFGIINTESSQNLKAHWEPFLEDMAKSTGLTIKAFFASDYAGLVTAMQYGKLELAWFGNKSAMEAVDRANGEVFIQTVHANGAGGYNAHLIVHKDSPINSLDDMFAKANTLTFGNGDPNSTSGFLVPGYYVFGKKGVDPKAIFKRTLNANHETNALSVANKRIDVATNNSESLERLEDSHPDKRSLIKVIWTSPLIPSDPLVWRKDLPDEIKKSILDFLLSYGKEGPDVARQKAILHVLQWSHFVPSNNDQLLPIRQLELFKEKSSIEANTRLKSDEKQAQVAAINQQLDSLSARMDELKEKSGQ